MKAKPTDQVKLAGVVTVICGTVVAMAKVYAFFQDRRRNKLREVQDQKTYDLVLKIHGHPDHSDWELQTYKEQVAKEEVVVAVFGDFNVGKTYVVNKLSGLNLPFGETEHTAGLSFKSTKHGLLWIDTAGMGAPYCVRSQTAEERYGTEQLIGELAYRLSDAQVVVVSHCSFRDQEFINALHHWQIHENRPGKNLLIVVHNYCRVADPDLLKMAFVNDVVSRFCIEEIALIDRHDPSNQMKVWVDKSEGYPIYHVLMGREGTPAGDFYNDKTFSSIFWLCSARLGFGPCHNYLDVAIHDLNEDLLEKYFGTRTRLRLNDMRNKLVPQDEPYATSLNGYSFHSENGHHAYPLPADNGGSNPVKPPSVPAPAPVAPPVRHAPPSMMSAVDNGYHQPAMPPKDARAALEDVLRTLDDQDPIQKWEYHF